MQVSVKVNGEEYTREIEPRMLLVHFLRDELGLTGTHWGCDTSNCGVCVVQVDGTPVKSCTILAAMASGHEVRTVEGLEQNGELDPIQQGFMIEHGLQCGFCTPGMMLTAQLAPGRQSASDGRRDPRSDLRQPVSLHGIREHRARGPLGCRAPPEPTTTAETEEVAAS